MRWSWFHENPNGRSGSPTFPNLGSATAIAMITTKITIRVAIGNRPELQALIPLSVNGFL